MIGARYQPRHVKRRQPEPQAAPAGLFQTPETRALKTERAIDVLREKFGKDAVVAGRALKP